MEWHLLTALVAGAAGAAGGFVVPRLVASLPEPQVDPDEDPDDFPDKVLYVDLAARPRLGLGCAAAGAVAGLLLGGVLGWNLALVWLMATVPPMITLAVVDYVTWYLPARLIWPTAAVVLVVEAMAAVVWAEPRVLLLAGVGFLALGGYYGLLWFISPRIMAFGDVRLAAALGLALGPFGLGALLVSALAAAVLGVVAMVPLRRAGNTIRRHLPYGPFLVVGALVAVVVAQGLGQS